MTNQCIEGEGDCDSDADCKGDLVCGVDNCDRNNPGFDATDDCCQARPGGYLVRLFRLDWENLLNLGLSAFPDTIQCGCGEKGESLPEKQQSEDIRRIVRNFCCLSTTALFVAL